MIENSSLFFVGLEIGNTLHLDTLQMMIFGSHVWIIICCLYETWLTKMTSETFSSTSSSISPTEIITVAAWDPNRGVESNNLH